MPDIEHVLNKILKYRKAIYINTGFLTKEKVITDSLKKNVKKYIYFQNFITNIRKCCNKIQYMHDTKKHIFNKLDKNQQIKH